MNTPVTRKADPIIKPDAIASVSFCWTRCEPGKEKAMNQITDNRAVTVRACWDAATDIRALELVAADGAALPDAEAGAHIDLHLPDGLVRQYSIMDPGPEPDAYRIGVLRERESRGGSAWVAEQLTAGDELEISGPRNHFVLDEAADAYVLIAGGIGITPVTAMARRLLELGKRFDLHYCVRDRSRAAFLGELEALMPADALHLHIDDEGQRPDLAAIVGDAASSRQVYACGPAGMLDAIREATVAWPKGRVHFEQFSNEAVRDPAADTACEIELRRSGLRFTLEADETLLEALHRHDVDLPCACQEGVCGTCAVDIVEGDVDHRDVLQDDDEKAENTVMFACVSRPLGDRLVLDL